MCNNSQVTNRRVNALENVVKPKLENTISYIKVRCGATDQPARIRLLVTLELVIPNLSLCSSAMSDRCKLWHASCNSLVPAVHLGMLHTYN